MKDKQIEITDNLEVNQNEKESKTLKNGNKNANKEFIKAKSQKNLNSNLNNNACNSNQTENAHKEKDLRLAAQEFSETNSPSILNKQKNTKKQVINKANKSPGRANFNSKIIKNKQGINEEQILSIVPEIQTDKVNDKKLNDVNHSSNRLNDKKMEKCDLNVAYNQKFELLCDDLIKTRLTNQKLLVDLQKVGDSTSNNKCMTKQTSENTNFDTKNNLNTLEATDHLSINVNGLKSKDHFSENGKTKNIDDNTNELISYKPCKNENFDEKRSHNSSFNISEDILENESINLTSINSKDSDNVYEANMNKSERIGLNMTARSKIKDENHINFEIEVKEPEKIDPADKKQLLENLLGRLEKTQNKYNINIIQKLHTEILRTTDSYRGDETWESLCLDHKIINSLCNNNFTHPSPVQANTIPLTLEGKDLVVRSKNGTGKTLSFVIPILQHLQQIEADYKNNRVPKSDLYNFALVLEPTRELAFQTGSVFRTVSNSLTHRIISTFGGTNYSDDIAKIERGVAIIVSTPGRILDFIAKNIIKMDKFRLIVIDEADKVLSKDFRVDIEKMVTFFNKNRKMLKRSHKNTKKSKNTLKKQIFTQNKMNNEEMRYKNEKIKTFF
ncbi:hypothetical protein EDEG_00353 [Edhazardia aedis USNM 41457]|uniref:ATP-dependent RNA helicase n=1 Tax=Edhazardia aedis (strain USNM 41457) TaxID=1003232 RepID=J9DK69_EDHAE|nr:hypothetical protein EDEG_00353 [Edhazardia aedis USNM 41457]|eukprot:EJW01762.1 hypothetical protein EDEG_00353 [Edhazardia aedis USNM 41457]